MIRQQRNYNSTISRYFDLIHKLKTVVHAASEYLGIRGGFSFLTYNLFRTVPISNTEYKMEYNTDRGIQATSIWIVPKFWQCLKRQPETSNRQVLTLKSVHL